MYLEPMRAPTQSGPPKQRWGKDGVSTPRLWILCLRLSIFSLKSLLLGRYDGSNVLHVQLYVLLYNTFWGMISSSRMKFFMMAIYYYGLINCSPPDVTVSRLSVQLEMKLNNARSPSGRFQSNRGFKERSQNTKLLVRKLYSDLNTRPSSFEYQSSYNTSTFQLDWMSGIACLRVD